MSLEITTTYEYYDTADNFTYSKQDVAYFGVFDFVNNYALSVIHLILLSILVGCTVAIIARFNMLKNKSAKYAILYFFLCMDGLASCVTFFICVQTFELSYTILYYLVLLSFIFGFFNGCIIFVLLLATKLHEKSYFKYLAITVFVFIFAHILPIMLAFSDDIDVINNVIISSPAMFFIACIITATLNCFKKFKGSYAVKISNIFFLMWLPCMVFLVAAEVITKTDMAFASQVIALCVIGLHCSQIVGLISPIIIMNVFFKAELRKDGYIENQQQKPKEFI